MPCLLLFKFRWSSWGRGWGSSLRLGFPAVEQPLPWPSEKKNREEGLPLSLSRGHDFKKQLFNSNWRRRQRQRDCQTRQFKTKIVLWIAYTSRLDFSFLFWHEVQWAKQELPYRDSLLLGYSLEPINEIVSPLKYANTVSKKPFRKKYVCVLLLSLKL